MQVDSIDPVVRHMNERHEEIVRRLAAISAEPVATRADIRLIIDRLDELERRIEPLELAVRRLVQDRNQGR